MLTDGLDQMISAEILLSDTEVKVYQDPGEREWANRLSKSVGIEDSDEDEDGWTTDQLYRVGGQTGFKLIQMNVALLPGDNLIPSVLHWAYTPIMLVSQ